MPGSNKTGFVKSGHIHELRNFPCGIIVLSIFAAKNAITLIADDATAGVHFFRKNTPTSIDACTFLPLYKRRLLRNDTVYSNKLYTTK